MLIGTALLSAAPAAAVDRSGFPLTVTDDQGIALTLAAKPQRIVSLTLPTDEMLLSLVEKSRLVGITTFAMDRVLSNVVDLAADIPEKLTLNVEKVISLRPDLLLVAPWNDSTQVLLLRKAGVPVYMMSTGATVEEIAQKIGRLAAMTGEAERGAAVVEEMRRKVRLVEQKVATVPEAKRLRVLDYASWGGAQGRGSSWDEVVRRAGLINAASQFSTDKWSQVPLSTEKLLTIDFDILMLSGGMYGNGRASEPFERQFLRDPVLRGLKAVKEGHVYTIPESLKDTTSQYIADAIAWLARTAYPELYR
jgi:iron complex transport system substrate-binding protein